MVRELTSFGPGIRPSSTIWSNSDGETPMYMADSSRERPRRGTGRISERARAMATTEIGLCKGIEGIAGWAERRPAVDGDGAGRARALRQPGWTGLVIAGHAAVTWMRRRRRLVEAMSNR